MLFAFWNQVQYANLVVMLDSDTFQLIDASDFLNGEYSFGGIIYSINVNKIEFQNISLSQTPIIEGKGQLVYIENNLPDLNQTGNYSIYNSQFDFTSSEYLIQGVNQSPFNLNITGGVAGIQLANNTFSNAMQSYAGGIFNLASFFSEDYFGQIEFYDNNSTYSRISARNLGGVLYCECTKIEIVQSQFNNVGATFSGGLIYQYIKFQASQIVLSNLILEQVKVNQFNGSGGVIWTSGATEYDEPIEIDDSLYGVYKKHSVLNISNVVANRISSFMGSLLHSLSFSEINIWNVSIQNSQGSCGIFSVSFRTIPFQVYDFANFNIRNFTIYPVVNTVIYYNDVFGSVFSDNFPCQILIHDCIFKGSGSTTLVTGLLFNISKTIAPIKFVFSGNNQILALRPFNPLFLLSCVYFEPFDSSSSLTISNVNCQNSLVGCIFSISQASSKVSIATNITLSQVIIKNIVNVNKGGILYIDAKNTKLKYSIINSTFEKITGVANAGTAMIIYDISQIAAFPQIYSKISNTSFISLSGAAQIFGYFNCKYCNIIMDSISINNVLSTTTSLFSLQVLAFDGFSTVELNNLQMQNVLSSNISINQNQFISVTQSVAKYSFTIQNTWISCQDEVSTTSFITFQKTIQGSLTLSNNTFKSCGTFSTSIYEFNTDNIVVTDSNSVYEGNSASSIYRVSGSNFKATIQNCFYSGQVSFGTGGIFLFQSSFTLSIYNSRFFGNSAKNGGIIGVQDASTSILTLNMTILNSEFRENQALIDGGVFWLSNTMLEVKIGQGTVFEGNLCQGAGGVFYLVGISTLDISNSNFIDNKASDGQVMFSSARNAHCSISQSSVSTTVQSSSTPLTTFSISQKSTTVTCLENTYSNNQKLKEGGVFYLDSATFTDSNSVYKGNSAQVGGAISCVSCIMKTEHCSFQNNQATNGGVIYMNLDAHYISMNDKFTSNSATSTAGVMLVNFNSLFSFTNAIFLYNSANLDSTISVYFSSQSSRFQITNCIFSGNIAHSSFTLNFQYSKGDISKCSFSNNSATTLSPNIYLSQSSITISTSTFDSGSQFNFGSSQLSGYYLYINSDSDITVTSSIFRKGFGTSGGAIFMYGLSNLTVSTSSFLQNTASINGGAIYSSGAQEITIKDSIFSQNKGLQGGNDYYGSQSSSISTFSNVFLTQTWGQSSIIGVQISLVFLNSTIASLLRESSASQGGGIQCLQCKTVNIKKSNFSSLQALSGGALYIEQSDQLKEGSTFFVSDSIFEECESNKGGAIYLQNPLRAGITSNVFKNNRAVKSTDIAQGGALFYTCSSEFNCDLLLKDNQILNCSSSNIGGGVYWDSVEPRMILENKYQSNKAEEYGPNYACFPQKLANLSLSNQKKSLGRDLQSNTNSSLAGYQSGALMSPIYIAALDKYGQTVSTQVSGKLQVRVVQNSSSSEVEQYPPILGGVLKFESSYGIFNVSGITFTGSPGSNYKIVFESDLIDTSKPSNQEYLASLGNQSVIDFGVKIQLRECTIGESFSTTGQCIECPEGTSYQLQQLTSPGICKTCPDDLAICFGGSKIGPKPGYWRRNETTENFVPCLYSQACLGITSPTFNIHGDCAPEYTGNICGSCIHGYSKNNENQCRKCPSKSRNIVRIVFILLGLTALVVYMIWQVCQSQRVQVYSFRSEAEETHDFYPDKDIHESLATHHARLKVRLQLAHSTPVSDSFGQIVSIDCLLDSTFSSKNTSTTQNSLESSTEVSKFYLKLLIMVLIPCSLAIVCVIVWMLIKSIKKNLMNVQNKIISSLIIVFFLVHPSVVSFMFRAYNCIDVDGLYLLQDDLQQECYKRAYYLFTNGVALPGILVWGLGIPIFSVIILFKLKSKLNSDNVREKYGFLYRGYKQDFFYWESVIMYRKMFLVFVAVIIQKYGNITQALVVSIMLIILLVINLKKQPFVNRRLNDLESISLAASIITFYCGVFFILSDTKSQATQKVVSQQLQSYMVLNQNQKYLLSSFILIANAVFLFAWIYRMFIELRHLVIIKYKRCYIFFCIKQQNRTFLNSIDKVSVKEKNEILEEEYLKIVSKLKKIYLDGKLQLSEQALEKLRDYLDPEKIIQIVNPIEAGKLVKEEKIEKRNSRKKNWEKNKQLRERDENHSQVDHLKAKDLNELYIDFENLASPFNQNESLPDHNLNSTQKNLLSKTNTEGFPKISREEAYKISPRGESVSPPNNLTQGQEFTKSQMALKGPRAIKALRTKNQQMESLPIKSSIIKQQDFFATEEESQASKDQQQIQSILYHQQRSSPLEGFEESKTQYISKPRDQQRKESLILEMSDEGSFSSIKEEVECIQDIREEGETRGVAFMQSPEELDPEECGLEVS